MGKKKDKPKSWEYILGTGKVGKLQDRYGVAGVHYGHPDGRSGKPNRTMEDVERDIAGKMMNDYHTNESFQNAAHAGHKGAKEFAKKGFKSGNIYDAWDTYKDIKKEYVGGGGMDGAKNIAGLTYATGKARDAAIRDSVKGPELDGNAGLEYYNDDPATPDSDYKSEGELAQDRVDAHERRLAPEYFGIDGRAGLRFSQTRTQQDEAKDFRDKFRNKLMMSVKQPHEDIA